MYNKRVMVLEVLTNILRLLKEQNKRQVELTNYLGLSKNVFTEWKAGRNDAYIKHLPKIAEFLDVSVDYLLGKEDYESSEALEFTYALYNELTHDLSQEQIEQIKQFADFLRNRTQEQNA